MGVFINTDAMTFFNSLLSEMNEAGLERDVDFYTAKGGVEAVLFNMNFQRCYWRSHSREAIWDGVEFHDDGRLFFNGREVVNVDPEPAMKRWIVAAHELYRNGADVFGVRYRRCHENGAEMWHSMRMNDVHFTPDAELPMHNGLWRERPDLWRCHYRRQYSGIWNNNGLDYAKEDVREYQMALVREYLEHECDGIELDWLRAPPICAPGMEEPTAPLVTDFVRAVRAEADAAAAKWGHRVRIAVRTPQTPLDTRLAGLDVLAWADEGLVDVVVPSPAYRTNNALATPIDIWRRLLPSRVVLAPCLEWGASPFPGGPHLRCDEASDAGFAASFYHRGADTIYFYNHFRENGGFLDKESMRRFFSYAGDKDRVYAATRRQIHSFRTSPYGTEGDRDVIAMPAEAWAKSVVAFRIDAGGGTADRRAIAIIGGDKPLNVDLHVNGVHCIPLEAHGSQFLVHNSGGPGAVPAATAHHENSKKLCDSASSAPLRENSIFTANCQTVKPSNCQTASAALPEPPKYKYSANPLGMRGQDADEAAATARDGLYLAAYEVPEGVLHDGANTLDIINLADEDFHPLWGEIYLP